MKLSHLLLSAFCFFSSLSTWAAVPSASKSAAGWLAGTGAQTGGLAGSGFTLLDIKSKFNRQAKVERLMIDVGDIDGKPQKGLPGFFHVELKNNARQIVVNFDQMPGTGVSVQQIKDKLQKSTYVKEASLLSDPSDNSMSLVLELKKPVRLKVFQVPGKKSTSKVVLDLLA